MKTVWKYPLVIQDEQKISVPLDSEFLSAIVQGNDPTLYFLVNPDSQYLKDVELKILGTGHVHEDEFLEDFDFLATVETSGGRLVWHIFRRRE